MATVDLQLHIDPQTHCFETIIGSLKPATHLANRRDRRKSPGVPGAAIVIFADRRDLGINSPISGM